MADKIRQKNGRFGKKSFICKSNIMKRNSIRTKIETQHLPKRRIIDMNYFLNKYDNGCENCNGKIVFQNLLQESKFGLASVLTFNCESCNHHTKINTSKRNCSNRTFSVNIKAALGMLHAGIGPAHVNGFLASLGIPGIHQKTMKKAERIIGPVVQQNAAESCTKACGLEKSLTLLDETCTDGCDEERPVTGCVEPCKDACDVKSCSVIAHSEPCTEECEIEMSVTSYDEKGREECEIEVDEKGTEKCEKEKSVTSYDEKGTDRCEIEMSVTLHGEQGIEICDEEKKAEDEISFQEAMEMLEDYEASDGTDEHNTPSRISTIQSTSFQETHKFAKYNLNPYETPITIVEPVRQCKHNTLEDQQNLETNITVSQDAAWSKRGRAMNSLSGWGHVIGFKTKKCLDFATRTKRCATCSFYEGKSEPVRNHNCRKNWTKSAKAMEPDMAVELHRNAKKRGLKYAAVIGDDDSSSIAHIREKVNPDIVKYSDFGHVKRVLRNKLEKLQADHKGLSNKVRDSFIKNFSYAVKSNRSLSEQQLIQALQNIVPHMYGHHGGCGEWCKSMGREDKGHANLPYGRPLEDSDVRSTLDNLIAPYIRNVGKLMTTGSSQRNESLNNIAWSKAPKIRNYNRSESFDFRVSTAVLQYNEGYAYLNDVIDNNCLSPHKETGEYTRQRDIERERQYLYKSTKKAKKRRSDIKYQRQTKEKTAIIKEGLSYDTGCVTDETFTPDINEIPDKISHFLSETNLNIIYLDLEATTVGLNAEITQIAAAYTDNEGSVHQFNKYVMPSGRISLKASEITSMEIRYENGVKSIFKNNSKVESVSIREALFEFISWIQSLMIDGVVLAAHNGKSFDFRLLFRIMKEEGILIMLKESISGFVDTLQILRKERPEFQKYGLKDLYLSLFQSEFSAHDALADVEALQKIMINTYLSKNDILRYTMSFQDILILVNQSEIHRELYDILSKHGVTNYMTMKIAKSGLSYKHLHMANIRDSEHGLRLLLSEKVNNKPRVTNSSKIIQKIRQSFL